MPPLFGEETVIKHAYSLVGMISQWDLGEKKPALDELVGMARQFNREACTGFLARLNLYLSLAQQSLDANKGIEIQERLTREVLSPGRLKQLTEAFAGRNLYEKYILLNRVQLLAGIKLLALYGQEEGGNCLESEDDKSQVGELALAINSCYGPAFGEPPWPREDVIVQTAASSELYNPETLVNGFVRTRILLGPILRDCVSTLKGRNSPPPFERIFALLNGLNFRDFLDIMLYLNFEHKRMFDELLRTGRMAYADVTQPKRYVSGRWMKAWADLMSVDHKDLKALVQDPEADPTFFFDFSMFRRFPLWRSGGHRYFCIDAAFLEERLSSFGFYWTVVNGLVDQELQLSFQRLWGELIQEYVRRVMTEAHRGRPATFLPKPLYSDDGTEVFDSAIVIDDCLVPVEIKSSVIPTKQKYAGEASSFYQGISAKFGGGPGAAVEQLLRNLGQIFSEARPRQSSIPVSETREIFPVVVVHEPILRFGLGTKTLADEFFTGVSKLPIRDGLRIYRLQVLDIETVERLEPHIRDGDFTLVEGLRAAAREAPQEMGFWQFMVTRFMPSRGIKLKPNPKLLGRFDWLTKAALWRVYRGDYYDHSLASRGEASQRAVICARPAGGDELLRDEVIGFQGYDSAEEAYAAIEEFQKTCFPKHEISADWMECAVVDEFGYLLSKPPAREKSEQE